MAAHIEPRVILCLLKGEPEFPVQRAEEGRMGGGSDGINEGRVEYSGPETEGFERKADGVLDRAEGGVEVTWKVLGIYFSPPLYISQSHAPILCLCVLGFRSHVDTQGHSLSVYCL